jgi:hypothetical protein
MVLAHIILFFTKKREKKKLWKSASKAWYPLREQWINSRFNCWQIYHSPPGYANTNSNIESFNRQIKAFTQKKKLKENFFTEIS